MIALGFDTSNYTTSAACYDGTDGRNSSRLLDVRPGELGLRQSDALFQHVKHMPEVAEKLLCSVDALQVSAVGASTRPRAVEGSYMPCFLAGESQAKVLAATLGVPFYAFSHQQGHIAAVLAGSGQLKLLEQEFLAWHLSGGTTELLHVRPGLKAELLGGTTDISAGQLIDRTGKLLGLHFPAGKALDQLASQGSSKGFKVKVRDLQFSLSGIENQVQKLSAAGTPHEEIAAYALKTCVHAVRETTRQALKAYGETLPVVFTGGVSSNSMLRAEMSTMGGIFGPPSYSTDNAYGVAVLTWLRRNNHE